MRVIKPLHVMCAFVGLAGLAPSAAGSGQRGRAAMERRTRDEARGHYPAIFVGARTMTPRRFTDTLSFLEGLGLVAPA